MDTTEFGAISYPGAGLQPGANTGLALSTIAAVGPVLANIAAQLQVLTASVQSIATTVGQLGGQLQSLQVTEMKIAENEDDELEEHDGLPTELEEGEVPTAEAPGKPML